LTHENECLTPAQSGFLAGHIPGFDPALWSIAPAGRAGSDRLFFRVKSTRSSQTFVLIVWDSSDNDWDRFLTIQRDVSPKVPFLPRIFASDDNHGLILEEDLGATTLKKRCAGRSMTKGKIESLYRVVLDALVLWQCLDGAASAIIGSRRMDKEMFLWESDYFARHCVGDFFGLDAMLDDTWERERLSIALSAAALPAVCIHRDFQSENILLHKGKVRFVDFQGARLGPAEYDVASLVFDPYVPLLSHAMSDSLFGYYKSIAPHEVSRRSFRVCAIQRLMQALGAYGKLSIHKGKDWYRAYIPVALRRLADVIGQGRDFPAFRGIVAECMERAKKRPEKRARLTAR
jgi:N-acetylmuramate 1-kinase